jgi:formylglycine-generating enzyme required for sulfatase activity
MPTRPGFEAPAPAPSAPFPPPAAKSSGSSLKWIVLAVVALFLLGGGAVGAFFAWQYISNRQQTVEVPPAQPAPQPEAPTAPTAPPAPAVPEGMVSVPGGTFTLGSDDPKADEYSRPAHKVEVKPFFLDATEVTNAQYKAFVDATGRAAPRDWAGGAPKPGTEQNPVVYVSWDDAYAYASWAGKRLPSETEWEFAARGTDGRLFPWGTEFDASKGNLAKKSGGAPMAVGSFPAGKSPYGALDMVGNVWEWTSSDFSIYPGGTATPPEGTNYKIIRGGAFDNSGENTALYRGFQLAGDRLPKVGFRCAKDAK